MAKTLLALNLGGSNARAIHTANEFKETHIHEQGLSFDFTQTDPPFRSTIPHEELEIGRQVAEQIVDAAMCAIELSGIPPQNLHIAYCAPGVPTNVDEATYKNGFPAGYIGNESFPGWWFANNLPAIPNLNSLLREGLAKEGVRVEKVSSKLSDVLAAVVGHNLPDGGLYEIKNGILINVGTGMLVVDNKDGIALDPDLPENKPYCLKPWQMHVTQDPHIVHNARTMSPTYDGDLTVETIASMGAIKRRYEALTGQAISGKEIYDRSANLEDAAMNVIGMQLEGLAHLIAGRVQNNPDMEAVVFDSHFGRHLATQQYLRDRLINLLSKRSVHNVEITSHPSEHAQLKGLLEIARNYLN